MKAIDGILETALYATDLVAAERFYSDVLGLQILARVKDRHVFFRVGQGVLLIFNPEETRKPVLPGRLPVPPHGTHGSGHACFRLDADDFAGWRQRLMAHGVDIEAEFEWPGGGHSLYFRDPAGNSLEFAEARIWGLPAEATTGPT